MPAPPATICASVDKLVARMLASSAPALSQTTEQAAFAPSAVVPGCRWCVGHG